MTRTYQILMPLFSLFLVRVDLTDLFPIYTKVKLLKIYDGDTLLLGKGSYQFRLRISKIDAPEMGQEFLSSKKDAGLVSMDCLKKIIANKEEFILKIEKYDMYKRVLGDVDDLSLKLIKKGCAGLYPYAQFRNVNEKFTYLRALKVAKSQRLGLWDFGGYKQPMIWRKLKRKTSAGRRAN